MIDASRQGSPKFHMPLTQNNDALGKLKTGTIWVRFFYKTV